MLSTSACAMPTMSCTSSWACAITGEAPAASSTLALRFITTRLVMLWTSGARLRTASMSDQRSWAVSVVWAMTFFFHVWQVGQLETARSQTGAVSVTSFPARGLPQSGSKGLSQSAPVTVPTPPADAAARAAAGRILDQAQALVQRGRGGGVLQQGLVLRPQVGGGAKGGECGLVKAAEDQLLFARVGVDVTHRKNARC